MFVPIWIILFAVAVAAAGVLGTIGYAGMLAWARWKAKVAETRTDVAMRTLDLSKEANAAMAERLRDSDARVRAAGERAAAAERRAGHAMGRMRRLAEVVQTAADKGWGQQSRVDLMLALDEVRTPRSPVNGGAA